MAGGRPTKFNQELADKICEIIATSNRGLRSICEELGLSTWTLVRWLADEDKKEFSVQYARAKESQADYLAEEILTISDYTAKDTIPTDKGDIPNNEWIARSRLRVDSRKWLASKLAPKKYGDKMEIDLNNKVIKVITETEEED